MSGRGLAKGHMTTVSLLICRMKLWVVECEHLWDTTGKAKADVGLPGSFNRQFLCSSWDIHYVVSSTTNLGSSTLNGSHESATSSV